MPLARLIQTSVSVFEGDCGSQDEIGYECSLSVRNPAPMFEGDLNELKKQWGLSAPEAHDVKLL